MQTILASTCVAAVATALNLREDQSPAAGVEFDGPWAGDPEYDPQYTKSKTVKAEPECILNHIKSCNQDAGMGLQNWCYIKMDFENCESLEIHDTKCHTPEEANQCWDNEDISGDVTHITMFMESYNKDGTLGICSGFKLDTSTGQELSWGTEGDMKAYDWEGQGRIIGLTYDGYGGQDFMQFNLVSDPEPVAELVELATETHVAFASSHVGNDYIKVADFDMPEGTDRIVFTGSWRDQGHGNKKGAIKISIADANGAVVKEGNIWGTAQHGEFDKSEQWDDVSEALGGSSGPYVLHVTGRVGGGGGHALYINNFTAVFSGTVPEEEPEVEEVVEAVAEAPVDEPVAESVPTAWACYPGFSSPMRRGPTCEVECMSKDTYNCMWGGDCNAHLSTPDAEIKPLLCGDNLLTNYGFTGYDKEDHWCAKVQQLIPGINACDPEPVEEVPEVAEATEPEQVEEVPEVAEVTHEEAACADGDAYCRYMALFAKFQNYRK